MPASKVETLTQPRDSLPNVYTGVEARELDFVARFNDNWDKLRTLLGITRPIRKQPGTRLVGYTSSIALESGAIGAGKLIPYSKVTIGKKNYADLTLEKYAKAVPIEDVEKYGAAIAIEKSDDAFLNELQRSVINKFYAAIRTNAGNKKSVTMSATETLQKILARMQVVRIEKEQQLNKTSGEVVVIMPPSLLYGYLGTAPITLQTSFGATYLKNFLGIDTIILDANLQSEIFMLPVENLNLYYIDPGDSEFAKLGLQYTVQGETNLIGFHANGNYSTAVGESFALMGMALWFEENNLAWVWTITEE